MADAGYQNPKRFDTSDAEAKIIFDKEVHYQALQRVGLTDPRLGAFGKDERSLIRLKSEQFKDGGVTCRITMQQQMRVRAVEGYARLKGNETSTPTHTFDFTINQLRFAQKVSSPELAQQHVPWNVMEQVKNTLSDGASKFIEAGLVMHATAFSIDGSSVKDELRGNVTAHTWANTPASASGNYFYRPNGHTTDTDVGADPSAIMDVEDLVELKLTAETLANPIPMAKTKAFGDCYVALVHPEVLRYWHKSGSEMYRMAREFIKGGLPSDSGLIRSGAGFVEDILIVPSAYCPPGVNSTSVVSNVRRGAFMGGGSLVIGVGKGFNDSPAEMMETIIKKDDFGAEVSMGLRVIGGIAVPNWTITLPDATTVSNAATRIVFSSYAARNVTGVA